MLKVVASGDRPFLDRYAGGLRRDCDKFGYEFCEIELPKVENVSVINHKIFESHIEFLQQNSTDRILLMDPECRIVKAIPQEWIDDTRPVIFYKVRDGDNLEPICHGGGIAMRVIAQPMFLSHSDLGWFTQAKELSKASSDPTQDLYARSEQFLEISLRYNKVDHVQENCIFDRRATMPHKAVRGNWHSKDTIIQHPHIHGTFDEEVLMYRPGNLMLRERVFESHTSDLQNVGKINQLFEQEIGDDWTAIDDWIIQPSTGKIKHKDYGNVVRYHHSIERKIKGRKKSTAVHKFFKQHPRHFHEIHK